MTGGAALSMWWWWTWTGGGGGSEEKGDGQVGERGQREGWGGVDLFFSRPGQVGKGVGRTAV